MPRLWFRDCIAALDRSNFLENASMETLQTITVLGCSGYDIAPPKILSVLHGCANRIAHILSLHRISPDPPPPSHDENGKIIGCERQWSPIERMEREIGKRVWWALVAQDWFWVPHLKYWCPSIPFNYKDARTCPA